MGRMTGWSLGRWVLLGMLLLCSGLVRADAFDDFIIKKYGFDQSLRTNLRVQLIGYRLAAADALPQARFRVYNDRDLNAMALPDGRIYVSSAMARLVTDDELAFVLGHELTHVKEKHGESQQQRATAGAILGAILVAAMGGNSGDIRTGADIGGGLTYGHYSRKDEKKADDGGVKLMSSVGYDPKKAANAMQRLIDEYGRGDAKVPILGWFASHPDSKERKQRIEALATRLEAQPPLKADDPTGVQLTLTTLSEQGWAPDYLAWVFPRVTQGRGMIIPAVPTPAIPGTVLINPAPPAPPEKDTKGGKGKNPPPLPEVTVVLPPAPIRYHVALTLRPIPAGAALSFDTAEGTAVEVLLDWTDRDTGATGTARAIAQTTRRIHWRAETELEDAKLEFGLSNGPKANLEGTLAAAALTRAATVLAEVITARGAIDHSIPVTLKISTKRLHLQDYVEVRRGSRPIAGVEVTSIDGKVVTGRVLWGEHTWKKNDKLVVIPN